MATRDVGKICQWIVVTRCESSVNYHPEQQQGKKYLFSLAHEDEREHENDDRRKRKVLAHLKTVCVFQTHAYRERERESCNWPRLPPPNMVGWMAPYKSSFSPLKQYQLELVLHFQWLYPFTGRWCHQVLRKKQLSRCLKYLNHSTWDMKNTALTERRLIIRVWRGSFS